ncbi:Hypothetical protein KVN_LOCUS138 [uncultured virus]|nr:Hypothetical protein KVN_LOCUS138 [uncultured virus]
MDSCEEIKYNIDKLIPLITCPLSKKIFYQPVIASDQIVYEKSELINHIQQYGLISPINSKQIKEEFFDIIPLRNFIDEFLKLHKQFCDLRFK